MKLDRSAFRWDHYSDQPATLDRRTKRRLRRLGARDELRKWLVSLWRSPLLLRKSSPTRRFEACRNDHRIGLCINLERPFEEKKILSASEIADLIEPLSIRRLAVRLPLRDIDRLEEYAAFISRFSAYEVLVVVLQDREFIEESEKLEHALRRIFAALSGTVGHYQIGNAVNRLKWGFASQREYLEFFETAWKLRNREFPDLKLLGGAVIDFELHEHLGSLNNRFPFRYDGYAALLYVDRRGAPENRQFGFTLSDKIELLGRLVAGSGKVQSPGPANLWITEVNWPLRDAGRHAPATGDCQVGESEQLCYLVRYFLLALASGSVAACFWHQLIAPGYGLIDNRGWHLAKAPGVPWVCHPLPALQRCGDRWLRAPGGARPLPARGPKGRGGDPRSLALRRHRVLSPASRQEGHQHRGRDDGHPGRTAGPDWRLRCLPCRRLNLGTMFRVKLRRRRAKRA